MPKFEVECNYCDHKFMVNADDFNYEGTRCPNCGHWVFPENNNDIWNDKGNYPWHNIPGEKLR